MKDYKELLAEGLAQICGKKDAAAIEKLLKFMDLVLQKNQVMNLTAITEPMDFVTKHYIDSLSICGSPAFQKAKTVVDVGTGAGFPGMPLAIVFPEKQFLLMDSLNKRIRFLEEAVETLNLTNVKVLHARAEELGSAKEYRESFDLCVSRAVAQMSVLCEYCIPFVTLGGYFVPYKADNENLNLGEKAIKILGGEWEDTKAFPPLTGDLSFLTFDHKLIYIKKIKNTPKQYPRKSGTPSKNPL